MRAADLMGLLLHAFIRRFGWLTGRPNWRAPPRRAIGMRQTFAARTWRGDARAGHALPTESATRVPSKINLLVKN
jgi:hypothetical protein